MSCCPKDRLPALVDAKEYKPKGETQTLGDDLRMYTTGAADAKKAVVVMADIFGMDSGRHFGIADQFGALGYYVVMPDLYYGAALAGADELGTAKFKKLVEDRTRENCAAGMDLVYAHLAEKKISRTGMIGFCYGSWQVYNESARVGDDATKLCCGVNCHPSLALEGMYGREVDDLAAKVKAPMAMLACGNDPDKVKPAGSVNKILDGTDFGKKCVYKEYKDMSHGFVSQGDLKDEKINKAVADALAIATDFFSKNI